MSDQPENPTSESSESPGVIQFGRPTQRHPRAAQQNRPAPPAGDPTQDPAGTEPQFVSSPASDELGDNAARALRRTVANGGSSRASIEATAAGYSPLLVAAFQGAGMLVHGRRTPDGTREVIDLDGAKSVGLIWVPSNDEAAGVADPVARIVARRMPEGVGEDSDLADALVATIAGGMFVMGQIMCERAWRARAGGQVLVADSPADDQAPADLSGLVTPTGGPVAW